MFGVLRFRVLELGGFKAKGLGLGLRVWLWFALDPKDWIHLYVKS